MRGKSKTREGRVRAGSRVRGRLLSRVRVKRGRRSKGSRLKGWSGVRGESTAEGLG